MQTSNKRSLADVEKEILATKAELENVHGTETEVYARIVGYYRAVKHWNAGKRDEYEQRKMFTLEDSGINFELSDKAEITAKINERNSFLQSEKLSPKVNNSSKPYLSFNSLYKSSAVIWCLLLSFSNVTTASLPSLVVGVVPQPHIIDKQRTPINIFFAFFIFFLPIIIIAKGYLKYNK